MKLTVTLTSLAALTRLDPDSLLARLRPDIERELQATAMPEAAPPAATRSRSRISPLPLGERT